MGQLKSPYPPYTIHNREKVSIFGLTGNRTSGGWSLGVNPVGYPIPVYTQAVIQPMKLLKRIVDLLSEDQERKVLGNVDVVAMSNRVAMHLFLEGVLCVTDIEDSIEGAEYIDTWNGSTSEVDFIRTPPVQLGVYSFPLQIFPEMEIGHYTVCSLDEDGEIV